ncbi:VOC family protein [uncultured Thalassolituus sp.]|uniref:VOC family protein n=1 Tax=uncultured Thalassolituus sp. TaxID=285273 RepID=UPI0026057FD7|nr:VOC family protein [uncultured Thalassolituus sp.]
MDLFNHIQIGYLVIQSQKLDEWQRFFHDGIGLHEAERTGERLAYRFDRHERRIMVEKGKAEDISALGIHVQSDEAMKEVLQRLSAKAIPVTATSGKSAVIRGVHSYYSFKGPKGLTLELYRSPILSEEPLNMKVSGIVTGDSGMGHLAITSRTPEIMLGFWHEIFDARISDYIDEKIAGVELDITFLRFNERHHSIAVASTKGVRLDPIRTQAQHVNLVADTMDDLVGAFRRLKQLGFEMAHEIGQHPNDKELSFYVITPSGFEWELGFDALKVNENDWAVERFKGISLWGHKPQKSGLVNFLKVNAINFINGIKSLAGKEYSPF